MILGFVGGRLEGKLHDPVGGIIRLVGIRLSVGLLVLPNGLNLPHGWCGGRINNNMSKCKIPLVGEDANLVFFLSSAEAPTLLPMNKRTDFCNQ